MTRRSVIIDTDPGIGDPGSVLDDGLAIAFALASPEIEVLGLTVVNGNVDLETGLSSAHRLLERLGHPAVPVIAGAPSPLRQGTAQNEAARWMAEIAASRPGEITVLAIGPLTNVAQAIGVDPRFGDNVREIVLMGGNVTGDTHGMRVDRDFNVSVDPEAAEIVLRSGATIRIVGIDQTSQVALDGHDVHRLRAAAEGNDRAAWIADCIDAWIAPPGIAHSGGEGLCHLHDPLVIAAVSDSPVCIFAPVDVRTDLLGGRLDIALVDTSAGPDAGADAVHRISAAVATDVERFRSLFLARMAAL